MMMMMMMMMMTVSVFTYTSLTIYIASQYKNTNERTTNQILYLQRLFA